MFLQNLTKIQQEAFLSLAMRLVCLDGEFSPKERQVFDILKNEMGIADDTQLASVEGLDIPAILDSRRARVAVILELIGIGMSDGCYGPEESAMIHDLAVQLNISDEELVAMEDWVIREFELQNEANKFFIDRR